LSWREGIAVNTDSSTISLPPFPSSYRASGVLLHVTSLPSRYGIGDVGPAALAWIDRLQEAGQTWWQALPTGPTGYGDSPYQALSSFAGNGLLLSPDWLIEDGLLRADDCPIPSLPATAVDYGAVIAFKHGLLGTLWNRFSSGARPDLELPFEQFCHDQEYWLDDYALFRALKARYNGAYYLEWPSELVRREPAALERARRDLADWTDAIRLAQFLLFRQGKRLKEHAHARGVRLIGDLPFFVSPDSSDVWAHPEFFLLDKGYRPRFVAGVPPDYFSSDGQLWGNPVYDWEALRRTGYRWCVDRFRALLAQVDVLRLDHFRAFAAAWHVPAGATTARRGEWLPGPGADFFHAVQRELKALPCLAEDLGVMTPDVGELVEQFRIPGTRVLQFAFDGQADNPHLPHNHPANAVVYTGTHDNPTTRAWFEQLPDDERRDMWSYLKRPAGGSDQAAHQLIRLAWASRAALAIAPLQDVLNLGAEGRMNLPGNAEGNWRRRCTEEMLTDPVFEWLGELTRAANRPGRLPSLPEDGSMNNARQEGRGRLSTQPGG
jgi:4-alpha-glucanotransferase